MYRVNELSEGDFHTLLRAGELGIRIGPYKFQLQSNIARVTEGIRLLYGDFPLAEQNEFTDFTVAVKYSKPSTRLARKAEFYFDHQRQFSPVVAHQAYASLEWGMNWCVSVHANEYLKLHSAVVARDNAAIIMPGVPGAGKSTLCAALGLSGWRVLSDEHALIPPGSTRVVPLSRPISLKNESIGIIKKFSEKAIFGPISEDTHKGSVAHLKGDLATGSHDPSPLPVVMFVFPQYSAEEPQRLRQRHRTDSFILAAYHSFNYSLLGTEGFRSMVKLLDSIECFDLVYKDLDWAIDSLNELHSGLGPDEVHSG